jgi:hypothetical protein
MSILDAVTPGCATRTGAYLRPPETTGSESSRRRKLARPLEEWLKIRSKEPPKRGHVDEKYLCPE